MANGLGAFQPVLGWSFFVVEWMMTADVQTKFCKVPQSVIYPSAVLRQSYKTKTIPSIRKPLPIGGRNSCFDVMDRRKWMILIYSDTWVWDCTGNYCKNQIICLKGLCARFILCFVVQKPFDFMSGFNLLWNIQKALDVAVVKPGCSVPWIHVVQLQAG